jgi:hypothetical protein
MVINVQRNKSRISNQDTGLKSQVLEWFNRIFVNQDRKKVILKRSLRTAMIMY